MYDYLCKYNYIYYINKTNINRIILVLLLLYTIPTMLDPTQLIEMTIYSKLISEVSGKLTSDIRIVCLLSIVYFLYKL